MSVTGTVAMSVARIVTGIFRLIGLPGMVGICVWLFFVGIPLLDWWPVNRIPGIGTLVEGEISRRIDAHEREQALRAQARAHEAERVLGEREAIRAVQMRRQADKDAQARIGFANAQAAERERFLRQRDAENRQRMEELATELAESLAETAPAANADDGAGDAAAPEQARKPVCEQTCKQKVITRYAETLKQARCGYPGDALPSDSFVQQYNRLTGKAGQP